MRHCHCLPYRTHCLTVTGSDLQDRFKVTVRFISPADADPSGPPAAPVCRWETFKLSPASDSFNGKRGLLARGAAAAGG